MIKKIVPLFFILCLIHPLKSLFAESTELPRTVMAFYKKNRDFGGLKSHSLHRFLEMPFNHLGCQLIYWDIDKGLPDLTQFPPLLGFISWYYEGEVKNPEAYLEWISDRIQEGKKFLVINNVGAFYDEQKQPVDPVHLNKFLNLLGIHYRKGWVQLDPMAEIEGDEGLFTFEVHGTAHPNGVENFEWIEKDHPPLLQVKMHDKTVPVATFNKNGGYINPAYFIKINEKTELARWLCNPFYAIRKVFDTDKLPKPDTTTLAGRRIYFSHIDGDGWQSISVVERKKEEKKTCAQMILERAILPFPDLPVTVAPIAANLDPEWRGRKEDQEIARRLFELPQVELASHTYSHPFEWGYYDNDDPALTELKDFGKDGKKADGHENLKHDYDVPRAYFEHAFNLERELIGSLNYIQQFAPAHKKARLLQWSGNCMPYPKALEVLAQQPGYRNINGGDSRYDNDYPSYSSVCPVGRNVGGYLQIYAVNSNENTYTDGWRNKFFGYRYLKTTFEKTESPVRVKAMNLYYHMYSGENMAALSALLGNLDYISNQEIIPIETYAYAGIGEGFYTTRFYAQDNGGVRIENRGELNTIRFDRVSDLKADLAHCKGVLGCKSFQGSLYVALDPAFDKPEIFLKKTDEVLRRPQIEDQIYLDSSRWRVSDLSHKNKLHIMFKAYGYGRPEMKWVVPKKGEYTVKIGQDNVQIIQVNVGEDHLLKLSPNIRNILTPHQFEIIYDKNGA